ncbi:aspartate aminotransferase family protein [Ancylobacter sp. 6x-1]|uniref:Acetylornithine aminotransferase n=1 Tax=Ancylobacter crimeensis TaxID=2579147 RepID=A0ABT0D7V2_9HYPH|nr:aspartate aminotransferase family protein [Ancylobacter crimeensis]
MIDPILPTYNRVNLVFERGEGAWLITKDGDRYLDFTAGIAVNVLGHAHPHLVAALTEQAGKLWHLSNVFRIEGGERLAERLIAATFADTVFFTNSGAEALECSIKMARRYHYVTGTPERTRIIAFNGAFHGRTLATIAAAGNPKYMEGFGPSMPGFDHVPFGDIAAVKAAIGPETGAILIEPVQGEGGVRGASPAFLRELRALCDENGLLLILDEVQCGVGRTGKLFAHEWAGITPDIMAVAKGIGGGFPVGACLATEAAAKGMTVGTHGSTYGGNPLAMAVANAVLDVVTEEGFIARVQQVSGRLRQRLAELQDRHPSVIAEVRGEGLLLGLRTVVPNTDLIAAMREEHVLSVGASDNVVRLLPPLIIGEAEIDAAFAGIDAACTKIEARLKAATSEGAAA